MKVLFSMTLMLIAVFAMNTDFKKAMDQNFDYMNVIKDIKKRNKTHTNIVYWKPRGPDFREINDLNERLIEPMGNFLKINKSNISIKTTQLQDISGQHIDVAIYTVLGNYKDTFEDEDEQLEFNNRLFYSFNSMNMFQYVFTEIVEKSKPINVFSYLENTRGADEIKQIFTYGKQNPKLLFQLSIITLLWAYANYAI